MYKPQFTKREVIVFHQFQRKGYSLFACLGREVVISVLSVATLSSATANTLSRDEEYVDSTKADKEIRLGDTYVTGSCAPLTQSQAARMVTVLSRDDIAQASVQSLNDLLKLAVGVDVRQRGPLGTQADISIRGGTQEQIIVLLNGINICDPQTGHNTFDLPCQLSDIVRVEVLEGPAGRAYGTSSLLGAINIVTTTTPQLSNATSSAQFQLEGGSYGYLSAGGSYVFDPKGDGFANAISAGYARSDGYSRSKDGHLNTDYSGSKAFYQGSYTDQFVRLSWQIGIADKGWGSSTFYASPRWQADNQYEHTTKLISSIQGESKMGALRFRPALYWNQHRDRYEGYRNQPNVMKYNYNRSDVYGVSLNSYFDWVAGRTAFGAELRQEELVSGNLGEPLSRPHHINGTDRDYTLGLSRTGISAHLEHNILLRNFTLSAGFVAAKNTQSDMHMTLYPGIDASLRLSDEWKLFASYNTSLRMPSFTELYYKLQGYAADPHLKPEEMQAVEVGAQLTGGSAVQAKATLFYHHGKNMIDWLMDTSQGQQAAWQSVNHTRIDSYGAEATLSLGLWQLVPALHDAGTTFGLTYGYLKQDKDLEQGLVSQYALEYLRHKLTAHLSTRLWQKLHLGLNMRWQDRVGSYTTFAGEVLSYRPYALVDARLSWQTPRYTAYAEATNLLDNRHYVDYGNVPQPGLWLVVGMRWKLAW